MPTQPHPNPAEDREPLQASAGIPAPSEVPAGVTAPPEPAVAPPPAEETRHAGWDLALMMATVALLGALGAQSLVGTLYVWWAQRATEGWMQGPGYAAFVGVMNNVAAPLVAALVVVLGLCVPKRLFARRILVAVSAGMLALGLVAGIWTRSLATGLTVYLLAAAALQFVVVGMTVLAPGTGGMSFLTEGRGRRLGSGLLHLGFIVTCLVVVAMQTPMLVLPASLLGTVLLTAGSAMSFYSRR